MRISLLRSSSSFIKSAHQIIDPKIANSLFENRKIQFPYSNIIHRVNSPIPISQHLQNDFSIIQNLIQPNLFPNLTSFSNPSLSSINHEIKNSIIENRKFGEVFSPKLGTIKVSKEVPEQYNSSFFIMSPTFHNIATSDKTQNNLYLSNQIDSSGKKLNYIVQPFHMNSYRTKPNDIAPTLPIYSSVPKLNYFNQPLIINSPQPKLNSIIQPSQINSPELKLNNIANSFQVNLPGPKLNSLVQPSQININEANINNVEQPFKINSSLQNLNNIVPPIQINPLELKINNIPQPESIYSPEAKLVNIVHPLQTNSHEPKINNIIPPMQFNSQLSHIDKINENSQRGPLLNNLNQIIQPMQDNSFVSQFNYNANPLLNNFQITRKNNLGLHNQNLADPINNYMGNPPQINLSRNKFTNSLNTSSLIFPKNEAPIVILNSVLKPQIEDK